MQNKIVIGGGAAGLLAAAACAKKGHSVTLIEKMPRPGRKLMITGKGRCNITNAAFDMETLMENIPRNGRFLYSAFSNFMPYDTIALIEELGVPTKIERGNRVFPVSDKAVDVVDALVHYARNCGVHFMHGTVSRLELNAEHTYVQAVLLEDGTRLVCDSVAVCTGGCSYPATGSTGDGYRFAQQAGHRITDIQPSLVPLVCSDNFIPDLQGLSLKNIQIHLLRNGKEVYTDFGEMLFTHYGVSGPVVLSASSHLRSLTDADYVLSIDLKPALDFDVLDKRLQRDFSQLQNKDFINALGGLLPRKLIPVFVKRSGIEPSKKVNQLTREERHALVMLMKNFTVRLSGFRPVEEAIVTSGGVDVKEVNPKTMGSKLVNNLYFAGEVLDVDGYTGGFNLQIAFSTGVLCGQNM